MGEIADALRRAQGASLQRLASVPAPQPQPQPEAPPRLRAATEVRPAPSIPVLAPADPAIAFASGADVEACRRVAVKLRQALVARGARSLAVVSAVPGEGKTTVLCDLAVALASLSGAGQVAVVDLDLRRPSIRNVLALPARVGIEEYLAGRADLDDVGLTVGDPSLCIYPTVLPQQAPHALLVSPRFVAMLDELERRHAWVLVDTPPVLPLPDASLILQRVAACLIVAREGYSRARYVKQLVATLPADRIAGLVLNAARMSKVSYSAYYYTEADPEEERRDKSLRGRQRDAE